MAFDQALVDLVAEAMAPVGDVTMRRMMGAATLYCDGTIFAVVDEEAVWFKGDADSAAEWDAAGCERFSFTGSDGKVETMNYRRAPDDAYDDPDEMRRWGSLGLAAGLRGAARKVRKRSSRPRSS